MVVSEGGVFSVAADAATKSLVHHHIHYHITVIKSITTVIDQPYTTVQSNPTVVHHMFATEGDHWSTAGLQWFTTVTPHKSKTKEAYNT